VLVFYRSKESIWVILSLVGLYIFVSGTRFFSIGIEYHIFGSSIWCECFSVGLLCGVGCVHMEHPSSRLGRGHRYVCFTCLAVILVQRSKVLQENL
jgi:hypothetical protein